MRYYLQVLTSKSSLLSPSVYLFFDSARYLFNTGEGLQRFMTEHRVRTSKLKNIFITSLEFDRIASLPSMVLNLSDTSPSTRTVHGPPGLIEFMKSFSTFVYDKYFNYIEYGDQNTSGRFFKTTKDREFLDDNVKIKIIPVNSSGKAGTVHIIECKKIGIKFNSEKLKEFGIKGKLVKDIQTKGSVKIAEREVFLEEVIEPATPQPVVVIFDVPYLDSYDFLLPHLQLYQSPDYDLQLFVHFTPKQVVLSESYIELLLPFPSTQNMFLDFSSFSSFPVFRKSETLLRKLNQIYSKVFPLPQFPNFSDIEDLKLLSSAVPNTVLTSNLSKFILSPSASKGLDSSEEFKDLPWEGLENLDLRTWESQKCDYKEIVDTSLTGSDPQLLFLGTASMKPGSYRNVSGIHFSQWGGSLLLDCGEGSYYQLVRSFGNMIGEALRDLKAVIISHMHADHHLGIIKLLVERQKVTSDPIIVVGPTILTVYLEQCSRMFGPFNYQFQQLYDIKVPGLEIQAVAVDHKIEAYGFVISHQSGWKMVYSGDTRPCPELIQAGFNATILIHEATFDDALEGMACEKFHSTISQALTVASAMEAWKVILTHYSQRYSKIPENSKVDSIYTFDLMRFNFSDCTNLAKIMPVLLQEWKNDEESETKDS
jgi:ribonuclease Z